MTMHAQGPRRELKSRNTSWARGLARLACASGLTPNQISLLSLGFAAASMAGFLLAPEQTTPWGGALAWLAAAAGIQLRLLCNLLDGMVAVEGGRGSATGPIYNEAPDRLADVLILVGAGYSTRLEPGVLKLLDTLPLGWSCAVLALGTAYVRLLQGSLTGRQSFAGPMAKQHRMAVLTLAALVALAENRLGREPQAVHAALVVILAGSAVTVARRLRLLAAELQAARAG